MMKRSILLILFVFALVQAEDPVTFTLYDLSKITFYGPNAEYRPEKCPSSVTFHARARPLPELATNKIGIFPRDISANGERCTGDTEMLVFEPIGKPKNFPPQWTFEDSRKTGHPVNFTCGDYEFSIRFGYFNDVQTPDGFLDPDVVYFDFAVIPNTNPFGFCSYETRRKDGKRPIDYVPFPTKKVWQVLKEMAQTGQQVPFPDAGSTPGPEETAEMSPEVWESAEPVS